jgi:hypothetical protein
MPTKEKPEKDPWKDILDQFSPDVIRRSLPSFVRLLCTPPDRRAPVDRCTPPCTQVKRSITDLQLQILESSGDCSAPPRVLAEAIVRGDWEYPWLDEASQKCSGNCKCGAEGDGAIVDSYPETRSYDESLIPDCRLRFIAKFTVIKRRRTGECRPI